MVVLCIYILSSPGFTSLFMLVCTPSFQAWFCTWWLCSYVLCQPSGLLGLLIFWAFIYFLLSGCIIHICPKFSGFTCLFMLVKPPTSFKVWLYTWWLWGHLLGQLLGLLGFLILLRYTDFSPLNLSIWNAKVIVCFIRTFCCINVLWIKKITYLLRNLKFIL